MKSSVLSVGTELTDGQTVNRNAPWLAAKCKPMGLRCLLHLTVPDDREQIRKALDRCASESDLIFITGGLGPTSDDFTREVVAEWAGLPLVFDESSWQAAQARLQARGYLVEDFQKQQCYFPEGSVILTNSQGTANGCRFQVYNKNIVILPGPPREIEAIWSDHLEAWLHSVADHGKIIETKSWDLVGLGESQVATLAEPLVQGTGVEVGYRVHLPYVEFKISYPAIEAENYKSLVQKIDTTFEKWILTRDQQDVAHLFAEKLQDFPRVMISNRPSKPTFSSSGASSILPNEP